MRTLRARTQWAAVVVSSLVAAAAWADHSITVDGSDADWASVTACFNEPVGDGTNGVDLTRTCVTNDNSSGDLGHLYTLYEAASALPTTQDVYFGFAVDLNRDGQITSGADEVYAVVYPGPNSTWSGISLGVFDAVTYNLKRQYTLTSDCGGTASSNGWSESKVGTTVELSVSYGCISGLVYGADNRLFQMGVYPAFDTTSQLYYNGTSDGLYAPGTTPSPAGYPAVTARSGQARLFWTNPPDHDGTVVVRHVGPWPASGSKLYWGPVNGTRYTTGQTVTQKDKKVTETYTVVFSEDHGLSQSFTDTGLTNGTRYYYKVFNHNAGFTYASGEVPVPGGIFAEPRAAGSTEPIWCYSTSVTALQQPLVLLQDGTYTAGNGGALVALRTAPSGSNDGDELWRPVQLGGAIQSRFPAVPLAGHTGRYLLTGTQSGTVAAVSVATGVPLWTVSGASFGGDFVQAYVSAQLYNSSQTTAAFKAANPGRDLIFVPTRIAGSTDYKVVALSSVNGAKVWESAAMSPILGGMMVDYPRDRLYVPTTSSAAGSLKILSTIDGTQVGTLSVGAVSQGVVKDFYWKPAGELIVVNDAGTASGFALDWTTTPPAASWTVSLGSGPTGFPIPMPNGFLVSTRNPSSTTPGAVERYDVATTGATLVWSTSLQNPSGLWVEYDATNHAKRVWASSSDLNLHGLDWATGTDSVQVPTAGSRAGAPMDDYQVGRLMAGLEDGRICAFVLPP